MNHHDHINTPPFTTTSTAPNYRWRVKFTDAQGCTILMPNYYFTLPAAHKYATNHVHPSDAKRARVYRAPR